MSFQFVGECPPLLVPESQNCSGRGVCVTSDLCLCNEPETWTGFGDFAFLAPSCAINIPVIQGLWSVVAAFQLAVGMYAVRFLYVKAKQKQRPMSPIFMGSAALLMSVCMSTMAIIRASNPLRVIGTDRAVTVLFCLGTASFWTEVHLFVYAFISLSIRQSRFGKNHQGHTTGLLLHMRVGLPSSLTICIMACMLPLGMLSATNAQQVASLATGHYLLLAAEIGFTALFLSRYFVNKVIRDLVEAANNNPAKSEALNRILEKMRRFQREARNQGLSNIAMALLFGCWPYLQIYGSSYFLPMAWISAALMAFVALYVNMPVSETKTSSTVPDQDQLNNHSSTNRQQSSTGGGGTAAQKSPNIVAPLTQQMESFQSGTN